MVILDAANGKTVAFQDWRTSFRTNSTTPIIIGNKIFISTGYRRGCALYEFTGTGLREIYQNKNLSNHMNNSVVLGDYLYGFDGNTHMRGPKQLVCLRWADGAVQWRKDGYLCGSLMAVQNHLLVLGETGNLALAQPPPRLSTPPLKLRSCRAAAGPSPSLPTAAFTPATPLAIWCASTLASRLPKTGSISHDARGPP